MLASVPLLVIPFLLFNAGLASFNAGTGDPWSATLLSVPMVSGSVFALDWGTALIVLALVLLFAEMLKSTRTTNASVVDHMLSVFVLVAFLVEFLLVPGAAHPVFLILTVTALVDVMAGFSVSLRSAGRDVNFG